MKSAVRQPLTKEEMMNMVREARRHYANSQASKAQMRRIIFEIHDRDGHKSLGYDNFQDMVLPILGIQRCYATQLVNATRVERAMVSVMPQIVEANLRESHLGVLYQVWKQNRFDAQVPVKVYSQAVSVTGDNRKPTANELRVTAIEMGFLSLQPAANVWKNIHFDGDDSADSADDAQRGSSLNILYTDPLSDGGKLSHDMEDGSLVFSSESDGVRVCKQLSMEEVAEVIEFSEMRSGKVSPLRTRLDKPKRPISPSKQESLPFSD